MSVHGVLLADQVTLLAFLLLVAALFLAFIRLVLGPTVPDRVVALDLMSTIAVGLIALYALATHQPVYLDAAIVLALISFLSTVAFASYLERRALP